MPAPDRAILEMIGAVKMLENSNELFNSRQKKSRVAIDMNNYSFLLI